MESLIEIAQNLGAMGLFLVSFFESFISPILPDVVLIPLALASPDRALYYSILATCGSVLGGFVGYAIGFKYGIPALKKFVPAKHSESIRLWIQKYGGWAVFLAALAPIPYKFVCISAGVFKVNMPIFIVASVIGRAKRFLIEGILIYYYGPQAINLMKEYSDDVVIALLLLAIIVWRVAVSKKKQADNRAES